MKRREWVVLTVVAGALVLLAVTAGRPWFKQQARMGRAMKSARAIMITLHARSGDRAGVPLTGADANACFAALVKEMATEKIFFVPGSAWHGTGKFATGPDNSWETSASPGIALEAGENSYAYNRLVGSFTQERIPAIATGFSETVGTYSANESELGGIWARSRRCVVAFTDGSGDTPKLDENRQLIRDGKNVFLSDDCEMLNPRLP